MAAMASDWLRHFRLILWNSWTQFNETWQEARSQRPLLSLCFWVDQKNCCPGLWLSETISTCPLKPLNGIQRNLTGSKISTSSTNFVIFFWLIGKTRWPSGLWLAETFFTSLKPLNGIITKRYRKQDLNVLYQRCGFFFVDRKNKMAALSSDWLRHFWLLLWNRWTEFNETWQEARFQRHLQYLCFSGRAEKQDGRPLLLIVWDILDFS